MLVLQHASRLRDVFDTVAPLRHRLLTHPLYGCLTNETALRHFMRSHVFAVFDFQSLLKALQRAVTCVEIPWLPTTDPTSARLINEIVLDEESDRLPDGSFASHFDLYRRAMLACGADTTAIDRLVAALRDGKSLAGAFAISEPPPGVRNFVTTTLSIAQSHSLPQIAAAFAFGREEVIPAMFEQLVARLAAEAPEAWGWFRFYLERHIQTDAEDHGPRARELVERACGVDDRNWRSATVSAVRSLEARIGLWDAIHAGLTAEAYTGAV